MAFNRIAVEPVAGALGAEIRGVDLSGPLDNFDIADAIESCHPVVRTHPGTGRNGLYVDRSHTARFGGWTERDGGTGQESKPLIDRLCAPIVRPG